MTRDGSDGSLVSGGFVRGLSLVVGALLTCATLAIAVVWVFGIDAPFDAEPALFLLGMVSTGTAGALSWVARRLEHEEYSLSYALAYGYVNNFVDPVITKLVRSAKPGEKIEFYIYIPHELEELSPRAIDRTVAKIRAADFSSDVVNLDLEEGRARDVMTVYRDGGGAVTYFDIPSTLTTVATLVDYRLESKGDERTGAARRSDVGRNYIQEFEKEVRRLIEERKLSEWVHYTDRELGFLERKASEVLTRLGSEPGGG